MDGAKSLGELGRGGNSLLDVPCVWDAMLIGFASGVAVAAHRYRGTRATVKAVDWGIKMWCATSLVSFGLCRKTFHEEQDQIKSVLSALNERKRKGHVEEQQRESS